jgi:hypothetical protein
MRELETYELARILVRAATGENYGDGYVVTDIVTGYAEPGYGSDDAVIVFGNWNDKRYPRDDDAPLSKSERIGSRLFDALESIGAHCEWLDEWTRCGDCFRAMRTQADSYSWRMYGAFIEDACDYSCADCILKDLDAYLPEYVNNSARCLTFGTGSDLSALGFVQWAPNDPQRYESGWHPGQDANPSSILSEIEDEYEGREVEVVFVLDESSQFYIGFSAWFRVEEIEDESDEDEDSEDAEEPNPYAVSGGLIDELRQSERMLGEW